MPLTGRRTCLANFSHEGAMDDTKPYKFIGFGAMDVTKPYKFIGFRAMDDTNPYKFIGFGAMDVLMKTGSGMFKVKRSSPVSRTRSRRR